MVTSIKKIDLHGAPNKKKIFLTGGNGLVGRNIQEHPRATSWIILAPTKKELNLTDGRAVSQWIKKYQPDIIIHAAGLVGGIKANIQNPVRFLEENVTMGPKKFKSLGPKKFRPGRFGPGCRTNFGPGGRRNFGP